MSLDFSFLNIDSQVKNKEDNSNDKLIETAIIKRKKILDSSSEILKEYQENKKKVIELNTQILKGAIAGMDTEQLLDISLDVISILIHDNSFKAMVKSNITRAKDKV